MSEFSIPFTTVVWTTGDTITEAKLDNMVANDQAYDAHEGQGFQLARRSGDPSTPASTKLRLYAKDYDGKTALFVVNENGEVFRLNDDPIITDQLDEATADHGIDIDGLNIKDAKLNTNDSVVTTNITANAVTNEKIRQSAARSVVGNSTASTANVGDITAGADGHVLRRSGTTIGFGTIGQASAPSLLAGPGSNYRVIGGWSYYTGNGNVERSGAVSFGITFSFRPYVVISGLGYKSGSNPSHIGDFTSQCPTDWAASSISTTGFTYHASNAQVAGDRRDGFSWIAMGPV